jgi:hypothetical protein
MSSELKLLAIKHAIFEMGLKFNQEPSDAKISAYAKDLMAYTPEQINFAFRQVINSGSSFFPSLAEILKHLRPNIETKEDRAPLIVKEIIQAIQSWNKDLEAQMIESVSEDARLCFLAIGNTSYIRNSENFETMSAQLERLVKGVLSVKVNDVKKEKLEKLGIVLDFKKTELRTMDYSNFLPESSGPA